MLLFSNPPRIADAALAQNRLLYILFKMMAVLPSLGAGSSFEDRPVKHKFLQTRLQKLMFYRSILNSNKKIQK